NKEPRPKKTALPHPHERNKTLHFIPAHAPTLALILAHALAPTLAHALALNLAHAFNHAHALNLTHAHALNLTHALDLIA
ncbi:MAG: hypothetical protein GY866_40595, partial [Proteobacteria bacterium]|nr:hypothetical protein [Pseudomonadota bacterium]